MNKNCLLYKNNACKIIDVQVVLQLITYALLFTSFSLLCFNQTYALEPYYQGGDGLVVIETDDYDAHIPKGEYAWEPFEVAGQSGSTAMKALPDSGQRYSRYVMRTSPQLDYRINFKSSGVHWVWIRGVGTNEDNDTVHIGLNGRSVATTFSIALPRFYLGWSNSLSNGSHGILLDIPSAGIHTINMWMDEDGAVIDKLLLTHDDDYSPAGVGPAASPRGEPVDEVSVEVSWEAPSFREDGSALEEAEIDGYEVQYDTGQAESTVQPVDGGDQTSVVLRKLSKGERLRVKVRTKDVLGQKSAWSDTFTFFLD